ncbi:unnamed protein product [Ostreobium quekettii]|uniref:DUF547 domain-containing protein n=1 Tax=Ostreobium quekettii TaxID=121088 RepID=A0A8S1IUF3_9CHLO|nr:unnamed protein product [Ostreobium quekettii]|eukprot:evm.model.scf_43EXC.6 EVM.evm.TU.scf_43EXC.6   scf_43EXC:49341-55641(-)
MARGDAGDAGEEPSPMDVERRPLVVSDGEEPSWAKNGRTRKWRARNPRCAKVIIGTGLGLLVVLIAMGIAAMHIWRTKWNRGDADISSSAFQCSENCTTVDHSLWTRVLSSCVAPGYVSGDIPYTAFNYTRLTPGGDSSVMQDFRAYLDRIQNTDLDSLSPDESLPFAINAYNAFVVNMVVSHFVRAEGSIRDLTSVLHGPVWKRVAGRLRQTVDGAAREVEVSLDDIEHQIIRGRLTNHKEPRIHSTVNCASISCPDLRPEAFTANGLDAQLDEQMRAWMANAGKGLKADNQSNSLYLSKIVDWYSGDFKGTGMAPELYLAQFAPQEAAAFIRDRRPSVQYFGYDWNLNSVEHGVVQMP